MLGAEADLRHLRGQCRRLFGRDAKEAVLKELCVANEAAVAHAARRFGLSADIWQHLKSDRVGLPPYDPHRG